MSAAVDWVGVAIAVAFLPCLFGLLLAIAKLADWLGPDKDGCPF